MCRQFNYGCLLRFIEHNFPFDLAMRARALPLSVVKLMEKEEEEAEN